MIYFRALCFLYWLTSDFVLRLWLTIFPAFGFKWLSKILKSSPQHNLFLGIFSLNKINWKFRTRLQLIFSTSVYLNSLTGKQEGLIFSSLPSLSYIKFPRTTLLTNEGILSFYNYWLAKCNRLIWSSRLGGYLGGSLSVLTVNWSDFANFYFLCFLFNHCQHIH